MLARKAMVCRVIIPNVMRVEFHSCFQITGVGTKIDVQFFGDRSMRLLGVGLYIHLIWIQMFKSIWRKKCLRRLWRKHCLRKQNRCSGWKVFRRYWHRSRIDVWHEVKRWKTRTSAPKWNVHLLAAVWRGTRINIRMCPYLVPLGTAANSAQRCRRLICKSEGVSGCARRMRYNLFVYEARANERSNFIVFF